MTRRSPLVSAACLAFLMQAVNAAAIVLPTTTPTPMITPCGGISCSASPVGGCRAPYIPGKAVFRLRDDEFYQRDRLIWKWLRGTATTKADFGNPLATTDYVLCVYDGSASLVMSACAAAGQVSSNGACWSEQTHGFRYRNGALDPDGLGKVLLREGEDGHARIIIKGQRENLHMPALPLAEPVRVQLVNGDGICWEATYSAPAAKNDANNFKDNAD